MTPKSRIKLFVDHPHGEINASTAGAFLHHQHSFHVIRPGYDAQGRRRQGWTQIVYKDVPIWEWKLEAPLTDVIGQFKKLWKESIGGDRTLASKALRMTMKARREKHRDGVSGETPAKALTVDGRGQGSRYTS